MTDCKSDLTPFLSGVKLEDGGETPLVDNKLYKQLVHILRYVREPSIHYATIHSIEKPHIWLT
jgi:hypothetical protein